jgi:hypothetical protein
MKTSRRNLLTLAGGAAAALPLTPVPWKLADDVSIWTQNWSWTPVPKRGELTVRYTSCTLCPAGCGVKARCIGTQPISLAPVAGHPISHGTLCPLAFGAHQLPWHRLRARKVLRNGSPISLETAVAEIAARARGGRVAVLDESPGRSASFLYAELMGRVHGVYVVPRNPQAETLFAVAAASRVPAHELGFDLERVRTVVSFGAPLLDGWGSPGRALSLWKEKKLRIIQVEPSLSRTATLAGRWLPVRPGTECAVARGLAGFTSLAEASAACGVPVATLEDATRELRDGGPAVALSGGSVSPRTEAAIAALNARLGMDGIVRRRTVAPASTWLDQVEPASVDVLVIDHGPSGGAVPWTAIQPKLAANAVVVSLTPYTAGVAGRAHYVIPAPAFLESTQDRITPWDAAAESYTAAPALLNAEASCMEPSDIVARLCGGEIGALGRRMRERVSGLHASGSGTVFVFSEAQSKPVGEFESAEKLWEVFAQGACWTGEPSRERVTCPAGDPGPEPQPPPGLVLAALPSAAVVPPLATKLDQESRVRRRTQRVYMHPATAPLRNGERVAVDSGHGSFTASVEFDASVAPGVVESVVAGAGPGMRPVSVRRTS